MRNCISALILYVLVGPAWAAEPVSSEVVKETIAAVGGPEKLLKLFRIKERLAVSSDPTAEGKERISVLQPPDHWWVGKKDRVSTENEPARFLVWGWTLGALVDPQSKLAALSEIEIAGRPAYGIEVSGTIDPPMAMYFDRETRRLTRIDWRKDQNVFSDWREADGIAYPAKCTGFRSTGKQWYHTEILELERLAEVPAGLPK